MNRIIRYAFSMAISVLFALVLAVPAAWALEIGHVQLESATIESQAESNDGFDVNVPVFAKYEDGKKTLARIGGKHLLWNQASDSSKDSETAYEATQGQIWTSEYREKHDVVHERGPLKNVIFSGYTPTVIYVMDEEIGPWHYAGQTSEGVDCYGTTNLPLVEDIPYVWEDGKAELQMIAPEAYDLTKIKTDAKQIVEMPVAIREWFMEGSRGYNAVTSYPYRKDGRARAWTVLLADAYYCDYDAKKLGEIYATEQYDAEACEEAIRPLISTLKEIDQGPRYHNDGTQDSAVFSNLYEELYDWNVIVEWKKVHKKADIVGVCDEVYTGKEITFERVRVHMGDDILWDGYFDVSYRNNVAIGKAEVVVAGKGECITGTMTVPFNILPISILDDKLVLSETKFAYTGEAPVLEVKTIGGKKLKIGTDYVLRYYRDDDSAQKGSDKPPSDAGIYTVRAIGKGQYADESAEATYTIAKAAQAIDAKNCSASFKGKKSGKKKVLAGVKTIDLKKKASASAKTTVKYAKANKAGGKLISVNKKTGKVTLKKGLKKGTYKVKVKLTAAASKNYKTAKAKTITLTVKIK